MNCTCTPYPNGDGPEQDCPVHGDLVEVSRADLDLIVNPKLFTSTPRANEEIAAERDAAYRRLREAIRRPARYGVKVTSVRWAVHRSELVVVDPDVRPSVPSFPDEKSAASVADDVRFNWPYDDVEVVEVEQ